MRIKDGVTPDHRTRLGIWTNDSGKPEIIHLSSPYINESAALAQFENVLLPKLEKAKRSMTNSGVTFKSPGGTWDIDASASDPRPASR